MSAPAEASSPSVSVKKIKGKTVKWGGKATIKPSVRTKGPVVKVRKTLTVKAGSKVVARNKTRVKLKAGKYKVTSKVTYKTYRNVAKTRHTKQLAYYAYSTVGADCSIASVYAYSTPIAADLSLTCNARGLSPAFSSRITAYDNLNGTWIAYLDDGSSRIFPGTLPSDLSGQRLSGAVTTQTDLYRTVTEKYSVRSVSSWKTKTRAQSLTIKTKPKPKPKKTKPDSSHECTRTASGTCIQGGQFCPKAKYGQSGWDASGRRYVCKGDSDHPHWYKP